MTQSTVFKILLLHMLRISITLILDVCEDKMQKEFLGCLYQFLKDPDPEMRISFSQCLSSLMENNLSHDKEIVPKLIIPAVLSLSVDMETEVQISSIKPLVTLFSLDYLEFEVREVNVYPTKNIYL